MSRTLVSLFSLVWFVISRWMLASVTGVMAGGAVMVLCLLLGDTDEFTLKAGTVVCYLTTFLCFIGECVKGRE